MPLRKPLSNVEKIVKAVREHSWKALAYTDEVPNWETILMGAFWASLMPQTADAVGGTTGYTANKWGWMWRLQTPATLNSIAWMRWLGVSTWQTYDLFDLSPQFELYLSIRNLGAVRYYVYFGGLHDTPEGVGKKFGIKIATDQLRLMSADGTTWSESANLMTLTDSIYYRIRVRLYVGSAVWVWVNGVQTGIKSTNIPTGYISTNESVMTCHVRADEALLKTMFGSTIKVVHIV